ncbi:hypothetical protein WAF17_10770 [Bernardetia sp. ABR2-2B]|uniref:hypothetical protein n=1 Tax=Bernardetia sp. ABR2-2B TaxID=3127472 RepID=UPI0030D0F72A
MNKPLYTGNLGTLETQAFFGNLGAFATTLGTVLQDGKINFTEGVQVAVALAPFGSSVNAFKDKTIPQIKDLYKAEIQKIVDRFKAQFQLANELVEEFIEDCISYALAGVALFNSGKRLFAKKN